MLRKALYQRLLLIALAVSAVLTVTVLKGQQSSVAIDADDIGGVVSSTNGPEAGVWVIAETVNLPTTFRRIVVSDDQGRYLVPDLPRASYKVWVRGYGLVDSPPVQTARGVLVNLTAVVAPNPRAAAQIYPSSYWYSLIEVPPESEFPGTGPQGNGINPNMRSQAHWISQLKAGCVLCHQIGNKATREIPNRERYDSSVAAWERRLQSGQWPMSPAAFGAERGLEMYADWSDRIAAGEVPPAPPRPRGVERNVVVSQWEWSQPKGFVHDEVSTDKRNPRVNANGPVYGVEQHSADVIDVVYPATYSTRRVLIPTRATDMPFTISQTVTHPSNYWGEDIIYASVTSAHNPMMDHLGRVWVTSKVRHGGNPDFCNPGSDHPSARHFPLVRSGATGDAGGRQLSVYDPKTDQWKLIDTCYGTHHLQFAEDANHTLWTSGGGQVIGWLQTKIYDETGDEAKAQGWCPLILDTNGNGRADAYVEPGDAVDPARDKRIVGGGYGIIPHPTDGSVWVANPGVPGSIVRLNPGPNPPETCLAEIYEPPFNNPASGVDGYTPRGIDVDRNGLIWTALAGSGHLASFDRRKCKVLNGPTATGQHCPEGWTLYATPGPRFKGTDTSNSDMHYYNWVDQFNTSGLGENVPIVTGTGSDSLLAFLPDRREFVVLRVPYPSGFYMRGLDGRIDDPQAGWKGRGLWANFGSVVPWHYEAGKNAQSAAIRFQLRPDPLAK